MKSAAIRDLCRKLTGKHTTKSNKFRIVPEWGESHMTDDDNTFGSCLIIRELKDFDDNVLKMSAQEGSEKGDWA